MFKSLLPWKHTKTKVMVPEQTMEDDKILEDQTLIPCSTCGRTFLPQPLRKHAPICEKNASKKRKVFDSLKQRVEGTDLAQFHQKSYLKRQDSTPKTAEKPKRASQWEESHRKLVDAIRSAKGVTRDMSPAKPKVQAISSTQLNERCPHCDRQFGPKAFDRHVEWCKEHQTRVQKSPANILLAKERLEARTKYKVPPLSKAKRTTIKEKYSSPTVTRTESVCSVKSTPTNPFRRNASVRKPKSVLNLGKKNDALSKADEKANSIAALNVTKKNEPQKSSRPKRFCPPRERVNLTHTENLECITVSPVRFVEIPAKKLVTWKEVCEKSPKAADDDSVIVVYENVSVFGKESNKQSFIEELKDLLTNSDEDETKSCSSLRSEDREIPISPKSRSSPEFGREREALGVISVAKSQPISLGEVEKFTNSNSEFSFEELSEMSSSLGGSKANTSYRYEEGSMKGSQEFCSLLRSSEEAVYERPSSSDICNMKSSEEFISDKFSEGEDIETSTKDFHKCPSDDEKNVSSTDDILTIFSNTIDSLRSSTPFIQSEHVDTEEDNNETNCNEEAAEDKNKFKADSSSCSLSLKSNPTVETYIESSKTPSLKSVSDHSFSSSKSSVNANNPHFDQSPKQSARFPPKILSDFGSDFTFNKTVLDNPFCPNYSSLREETKYYASIEEYGVPKKRRKLNSTFVIERPSLLLRKNIAGNKDEKEVKTGDVDKGFLPRIVQKSDKNITVKENKKSSECKLPLLETRQKKPHRIFETKWQIKERSLPFKKDISDVFLSYQSFGSGDAAQKKVAKSTAEGNKGKREMKNKVNKIIESREPDLTVKPEDLFAVDDKMYAEYKIFEEMYLKEKEQMANTRRQRTKNAIKSYGIEIANEDYTNQNSKVSGDSAYGSLNRNSPKAKTTKLSPLQRQRIDSASSSGSENFVPPVQSNHRMSKFCHECGNKYPLTTAKFCPECGVKRLLL